MFKLEPRPVPSKALTFASPLIALFITVVIGVCLFVASSIAKISVGRLSVALIPFIAVSLLVLLLVSFVPQVTLFLPNLVFNK